MPSAREAVIAFGRQTAKGTALTVPKFEIPMGTGHASPNRSIQELPWTNDSQDPIGHYVNFIEGVVSLSGLPVLPVSSPALWKFVLGTLTTSGSGPYEHEGVPADDMDWWTFFYAEPSGDFWKIPDVKCKDATLSWSPGSPLSFDVNASGGEPVRLASKWGTATVTDTVDPFLTYIEAAMLLEAITTPAATQVHNIQSGSVSINRNTETLQTDGISAYDQVPNKREIAVELPDVVFTDANFRRAILTGSTSGTAVSQTPTYGSAKFTFKGSDDVAATTRGLEVELPRLLWATEPIEADPAGNTLTWALAGSASKPSSGSSIIATTTNADTGVNY